MAKYYGINGKTQVLKNLRNVMKAAGQKYSIRVGIIGEKAGEIHPGTNLTNAQLGAVHEFGAEIDIKHPGGQPYYINSSTGMAVFVSKKSLFGQYLTQKGQVTKPHTIHVKIPKRSFLRDTLLNNPQIKEQILEAAGLYGNKDIDVNLILNKIAAGDTQIMDKIAEAIGGKALGFVQEAFKSSGFGKWPPITEYTKEHRKNDKTSHPLQDGGDLLDSVTEEVKKLNG